VSVGVGLYVYTCLCVHVCLCVRVYVLYVSLILCESMYAFLLFELYV